MSANPKVLRYADALREAALDDDTAAASYEAIGGSALRDVARYRTRAAALRALADLCEQAEAECDVSDAEAGPVGVWSTDSLLRAQQIVRAIAAGYREARDA